MNTIHESIDEICQLGEVAYEGTSNSLFLLSLKSNLYNVAYEASKFDDGLWTDLVGGYKRLLDSEVKPIIENNFPSFHYYHVCLNKLEISEDSQTGFGDAIDDLCDIIKDLLEVRWRVTNINEDDGLSYLRFIFNAHTEDHIIGLVGYLNEKLDNYTE